MQAFVAGLHRRKGVEPIPPRRQPSPMGVGDALGLPGGAAGVADDEQVVLTDVGIWVGIRLAGQPAFVAGVAHPDMGQVRQLVGQAFHFVPIGLTHEQQPTAGVAEHVPMRIPPVARIERHPHEIGGRRGAKQIRRLNGVVLQHPHSVAGLEAGGEHGIGEPQRAAPGFPKGQAALAMRHGL